MGPGISAAGCAALAAMAWLGCRSEAPLAAAPQSACAKPLCWVPRSMRTLDVLRCADAAAGPPDPEQDDSGNLVLAPAPGVERVTVDDDYVYGGCREIPSDGSVRRARMPFR